MKSLYIFTLILFTVLAFSGCSNTEETKTDPGSIQTQTEVIGHEASQMIKTPMDRASSAADKENLRNQQLEDRLNSIE